MVYINSITSLFGLWFGVVCSGLPVLSVEHARPVVSTELVLTKVGQGLSVDLIISTEDRRPWMGQNYPLAGMYTPDTNVSKYTHVDGLVSTVGHQAIFNFFNGYTVRELVDKGLSTAQVEQIVEEFITSGESYDPDTTGHQDDVMKRGTFYQFVWSPWERSAAHGIKIAVFSSLADTVARGTDGFIQLAQSAYCQRYGGNQACISWSGGSQAVYGSVLKAVTLAARGEFGDDALSLEDVGSARQDQKLKRDGAVHTCVSNRPNGCGQPREDINDQLSIWNRSQL